MAKIISGEELAKKIREKIKKEVAKLELKPCLAVILVGENPASKIYTDLKEKACKEVGIVSKKFEFGEGTEERCVIDKITELNEDAEVDGILVQLPLPKKFEANKIVNSISPDKDVDGLHPLNLGKLSTKEEGIVPCTPKGIIKLIENEKIKLEGKEIVIINHSRVIGRPLVNLLLNRDATVSVCHVKTKDLKKHTEKADIIITATGVPKLISAEMVKEGAVVIDAGFSKKGKKNVGDVDFEGVKEKASITPVPGGVGPMTLAMLLENCVELYKKRRS